MVLRLPCVVMYDANSVVCYYCVWFHCIDTVQRRNLYIYSYTVVHLVCCFSAVYVCMHVCFSVTELLVPISQILHCTLCKHIIHYLLCIEIHNISHYRSMLCRSQ